MDAGFGFGLRLSLTLGWGVASIGVDFLGWGVAKIGVDFAFSFISGLALGSE